MELAYEEGKNYQYSEIERKEHLGDLYLRHYKDINNIRKELFGVVKEYIDGLS